MRSSGLPRPPFPFCLSSLSFLFRVSSPTRPFLPTGGMVERRLGVRGGVSWQLPVVAVRGVCIRMTCDVYCDICEVLWGWVRTLSLQRHQPLLIV
jgi:hypothetical protein